MLQFDVAFDDNGIHLPCEMDVSRQVLNASFDHYQQGGHSQALTATSIVNALGYKPMDKDDLPKIGDTLKIENGILNVNAAQVVEEDNTRPVTSAAVYVQLGNIEALLANL